jgi:ABC-type nitrate/sulfonate/bicarbonate transport system substrate-binding protein
MVTLRLGGAMSRRTVFAVAVALAAVTLVNTAAHADPLVLQLHGPAQFEFAGYYAALWQGFYSEAELDVEIRPGAGRGQAPIDPVRELTEGRAQFGIGGTELAIRAAQGLPVVLLAPIFQQSGAAVYYRADTDLSSPAALGKAKLARLPPSNILEVELATALRAEGIDPAKLKTVAVEPPNIAAALADKTVDAATGSAWEVPWLAREKGVALKSFDPGDYRVQFYGDTLFALKRLARTEPDTVRRFRAASLKGWDYVLQHPHEMAGQLTANLPAPPGIADAPGFAAYQLEVARRLARYPDVPLGHSNPDRWNRIEASLLGAGAVLRTVDADDFVYDPDADARSRADFRAFAILGATLFVGLLITALFWLRWRRPAPARARRGARAKPPPQRVARPAARPPTQPNAAPAAATQPEPVPADLNGMLNRLERAIRRRLPRGATLRLSLLPELWRCGGGEQTVQKLLLGLVAGAAAELAPGGQLIIGTRNYAFDEASVLATPGAELGEFVRLTVRDSGPGLSDEALDRVLDPALTTRPSAAAAATALCRIGGFVRVESAEGIGTAVHLYFPRVVATVAVATEKPAAAAE